ncbi:hypothetical protein [Rhizobium azibense]|uniref:Uncharacterized protein n=1 Tax=Rhizobium azibense TaxID=1136135 RepID=A0A4R3RGB3_9HYPH|nr:hypothetical protein [Rhizobium azibense]TCU34041.1 hypothetical protein EV129_11324 [Rhizobium azibense]
MNALVIEIAAALNLAWVFGFTNASGVHANLGLKVAPVIIAGLLVANAYARFMGWPV